VIEANGENQKFKDQKIRRHAENGDKMNIEL
jgi:hypothetical protein